MLISELMEAVNKLTPPKPRNFVAKNAAKSGAGAHKDKKKAQKQGQFKHKKLMVPMESASAGATSAANVSIGPVYKNKPAKTPKNTNGTAKNAVDLKGTNLITGGSLVKR